MPPFDRAEYADRLRRVRARMSDQGLDALIVSDPANMAYLTGYDGWSFYTPQGVAVGLDVDPVLFTRLMDANGARVTTYLDDDAILGFPDHYVQARDKHPLDWVAGELQKRGLGRGTIGVESDAYYFTPRAYHALEAGLGDATLVDSAELVNWVRVVKSPAELAVMREAAQIMERVIRTGIDAVRPGRAPVRRGRRHLRRAGRAALGAFGGEYTSFVPMLPTGVGTSTPHLTWSDAPFTRGRGDDPRARRLPPPLPRADGAHGVPRHAAAEAGRHGGGRGRGHGGGARRRPARASRRSRSRPPGARSSRGTGSRRSRGSATPSASTTRPTGASTPSRSGPATRRSCRPT